MTDHIGDISLYDGSVSDKISKRDQQHENQKQKEKKEHAQEHKIAKRPKKHNTHAANR